MAKLNHSQIANEVYDSIDIYDVASIISYYSIETDEEFINRCVESTIKLPDICSLNSVSRKQPQWLVPDIIHLQHLDINPPKLKYALFKFIIYENSSIIDTCTGQITYISSHVPTFKLCNSKATIPPHPLTIENLMNCNNLLTIPLLSDDFIIPEKTIWSDNVRRSIVITFLVIHKLMLK